MTNVGQDNAIAVRAARHAGEHADLRRGLAVGRHRPQRRRQDRRRRRRPDGIRRRLAQRRGATRRRAPPARPEARSTSAPSTSVKFRVHVTPPVPTGTVVSNQAGLAFNGQQSGVAFNARSDGDAGRGGSQPTVVSTVSALDHRHGVRGRQLRRRRGAHAARARRRRRAPARASSCTTPPATSRPRDHQRRAGSTRSTAGRPGSYTVRVVNSTVTRPASRRGGQRCCRSRPSAPTRRSARGRIGDRSRRRRDAVARRRRREHHQRHARIARHRRHDRAVGEPGDARQPQRDGLDFGFNFDTIVNANDTGQGSLRQFIINSNALTNAGARADRADRRRRDLRLHGQRRRRARRPARGAHEPADWRRRRRSPARPHCPRSPTPTRIDGATQTTNVGDTNPALVGSAATVGVDALALRGARGPRSGTAWREWRRARPRSAGHDLAVAASRCSSFGNAAGSNNNADIRVGAAATRALIERCVIGSTAQSFTDPGSGARSGGDHVRVLGGDNGIVRDCAHRLRRRQRRRADRRRERLAAIDVCSCAATRSATARSARSWSRRAARWP